MTLRCLFGHRTKLVTEGREGRIECARCGRVLDRWDLLRPEETNLETLTRERFFAEREQRARQMSGNVRAFKRVR
jgi:hypothetical protein